MQFRYRITFLILILGTFALYFINTSDKSSSQPNAIPTNPEKDEVWHSTGQDSIIDYREMISGKRKFDKKFSEQAQSYSRDAAINSWEEKGPFEIGGRMRCLAIDPNDNMHIFAGAETGGIWETSDGGSNWAIIDDFLPSLVVSDIVYDPFNSSTILAGTGRVSSKPGVGILKSIDNGVTWAPIAGLMSINDGMVSDIEFDPNNQNWIYAGFGGQLLRSIDGGFSWNNLSVGFFGGTIWNIEVDPFNSDNVLLGRRSSLYRSSNAQSAPLYVSFTEITGSGIGQIPDNNVRVNISFCPSIQDRAYAIQESIDTANNLFFKSEDAGANWFPTSATGLEDDASRSHNVIWVDPTDSKNIIAGGVDIYRSTDGGGSFVKISNWKHDINGNNAGGNNSLHADNHMILPFNNFNGTSQRGVYIANDGGLYSTKDIITATENSGWLSNVGNLSNTQCYGGAISPDGKTIIVGTQDNSYALTTNGGSYWDQPTTGDGSVAAINYTNDNVMYANLNYNALMKSTNGGQDWDYIAFFGHKLNGSGTIPAPPSWPPCALNSNCVDDGMFFADDQADLISPFIMDPNDPNIILASGRSLWRNKAAGDPTKWFKIKDTIPSNNLISAMAVEQGNSNTIWVAYRSNRLERTKNNGSTWSGDIGPQSMVGLLKDICINPNNSNEVIVCASRHSITNLYLTTNANDANPTWTNISTGIPIPVYSIAWHPDNSSWIYVGTSLGLLASENKGTDWAITPLHSESEGPVNTEIVELFFQPNTTKLVAVTYGRGVWISNNLFPKVYVDKNHTGNEEGTFSNPFTTFTAAYDFAGNGSEIVFLSGGTYDDINTTLLMKKRLSISGLNNTTQIVIE